MIFKRYFKRFQILTYKKVRNFCLLCQGRRETPAGISRYEIPSVVGFANAAPYLCGVNSLCVRALVLCFLASGAGLWFGALEMCQVRAAKLFACQLLIKKVGEP